MTNAWWTCVGHSWKRVTLHRGAGQWWKGHFTAPKKPHGFVSVRAAATMDSGYSIKQEIVRAYGLR